MNRSKHPPLTELQIKNIRMDLKDYMTGKLKLKDIAIKHKIIYQTVVALQNQIMEEILNNTKNK